MDIARQTRDEFLGLELDWLLQDREGRLALCHTAGFGEVPRAILVRGRAVVQADEASLEHLLEALPVTGRYRPRWGRIAKDPLSRELATRGLYVYVWRSPEGPYVRRLRPACPARLSEIESRVPGLSGRVPSVDLLFRRVRRFELPRYLPCLGRDPSA